MKRKPFISYRRDDSEDAAQTIYKTLLEALPRHNIFLDVDSIAPGVDFIEALKNQLDKSDILLALIGPAWIGARNPKTGQRRLDDPEDFVRIEIRMALERDILVVPVLIDEAKMPDVAQLPNDVKYLATRQAAKLNKEHAWRLTRKLSIGQIETETLRDIIDGGPKAAQLYPDISQSILNVVRERANIIPRNEDIIALIDLTWGETATEFLVITNRGYYHRNDASADRCDFVSHFDMLQCTVATVGRDNITIGRKQFNLAGSRVKDVVAMLQKLQTQMQHLTDHVRVSGGGARIS